MRYARSISDVTTCVLSQSKDSLGDFSTALMGMLQFIIGSRDQQEFLHFKATDSP